MRELDEELRRLTRREQPPPGFAERVLRRVADETATPGRDERRAWLLRLTAAAILVIGVAGVLQYRTVQEERERARGEAAREQVLEALRIAGSKLHTVQEKIRELGS
jgi:hypothetical protein